MVGQTVDDVSGPAVLEGKLMGWVGQGSQGLEFWWWILYERLFKPKQFQL
jgi:hypothetical protein